jgi:hypothetical protein
MPKGALRAGALIEQITDAQVQGGRNGFELVGIDGLTVILDRGDGLAGQSTLSSKGGLG